MSSKNIAQDPAEIIKDDIHMDSDVQEGDDQVSTVLDELVEMFVKENKRTPTEDEMKQWIKVFRSLSAREAETVTE